MNFEMKFFSLVIRSCAIEKELLFEEIYSMNVTI